MPGQSYRSKLNPHLGFIREARLRGETWEGIARRITERGTPADRSQVCKFFLRRERGRRPAGFTPGREAAAGAAAPAPQASAGESLEEAPGSGRLVIKVSA